MMEISRCLRVGKPHGHSDFQVLWPAEETIQGPLARMVLPWLQLHARGDNAKIAVGFLGLSDPLLVLVEFGEVDNAGRRISNAYIGRVEPPHAAETTVQGVLWWYRHGAAAWLKGARDRIRVSDLAHDNRRSAPQAAAVQAAGRALGWTSAAYAGSSRDAVVALRALDRLRPGWVALLPSAPAGDMPDGLGIVITDATPPVLPEVEALLTKGFDILGFDIARLRNVAPAPRRATKLAMASLTGALEGAERPLSQAEVELLLDNPRLRPELLPLAEAPLVGALFVRGALTAVELHGLSKAQLELVAARTAAPLFADLADALTLFIDTFGVGADGVELVLDAEAVAVWRLLSAPEGPERPAAGALSPAAAETLARAGLLSRLPAPTLAELFRTSPSTPVTQAFRSRLGEMLPQELVRALLGLDALASCPSQSAPPEPGSWIAAISAAHLASVGPSLCRRDDWRAWWRSAIAASAAAGNTYDSILSDKAFWWSWRDGMPADVAGTMAPLVSPEVAGLIVGGPDGAGGLVGWDIVERLGPALRDTTLLWQLARFNRSSLPTADALSRLLAVSRLRPSLRRLLEDRLGAEPARQVTGRSTVDELTVDEMRALLPLLDVVAEVVLPVLRRTDRDPAEECLLAEVRTSLGERQPPAAPIEPELCRQRPGWGRILLEQSGWGLIAEAVASGAGPSMLASEETAQ